MQCIHSAGVFVLSWIQPHNCLNKPKRDCLPPQFWSCYPLNLHLSDEGEMKASRNVLELELQLLYNLECRSALPPAFQVHEDGLVSLRRSMVWGPWSMVRGPLEKFALQVANLNCYKNLIRNVFNILELKNIPIDFKQPQRDREWGRGSLVRTAMVGVCQCQIIGWDFWARITYFCPPTCVEIILAGNRGGTKTMACFLKMQIEKCMAPSMFTF